MKNKLKTVTEVTEDVAAERRVKLSELPKLKDKAVRSVKTFRKEIGTFFDNLEISLIQEIETRFKTIGTEIKVHISELDNLAGNLRDASVKLQSSEGNRAQEFVSSKSVEKDMDKSRRALDSILKYEVKTIDFEANSEIRKLFQQIKSLGTIVEQKQMQHSAKTSLYKIKRQRQMNVEVRGSISGAYITDNGLLLLADFFNDKLKCVNLSSGSIKDSIHFKDPCDVCVVSSSEAAVCLWNQYSKNSSVQFVILGDQMSASRRFKLNHPGRGIAYHDGKLFITDNQTAVYTYDLAGRVLSKTTTDALGHAIFSKSRKISISTLTKKVYVADSDKGVVTLDTQGKHVSTFSDLSSMRPTAISTDGINVFVAGEKSNSVMQIGPDGKIIGSFGDVFCVESLCFDVKNNTLIVSENSRNEIKIYELE
jgi:hypothetical protein